MSKKSRSRGQDLVAPERPDREGSASVQGDERDSTEDNDRTGSPPTGDGGEKDTTSAAREGRDSQRVPVVGIGASAGGLEAFKALLRQLPGDTGMAYVLVQHLDPNRESMLVDILARHTRMDVIEASDGARVAPNCVYVIPPDRHLAVLHGQLQLLKPPADGRKHLPVDLLFRSLAEDAGPRAVGVILSGSASDGTLGLKAIKAAGGITFAQDEESAQYFGMPGSAIASGCVDFVLSPAEIARELERIARHPYLLEHRGGRHEEVLPGSSDELNKVFAVLRTHTGHDFTYYKHTTIKRRIKRRMLLHRLERLGDYVALLQSDRDERDALFQDITINVTGFFREPETFEALAERVVPELLAGRTHEAPVRIWVAGCSTGEEAYSLAMVILEQLGSRVAVPVQIFGTDIDERAIEKARAGTYPERIAAEVSPERLRRFFSEVSGGWQISKTIRDLCVFAPHDVTRDPPFSRLDLVCCRNLLIYLGTTLQRRVLQVFHYALKPNGYLVLGGSESIGPSADLFQLMQKEGKIYSKKETGGAPAYDLAARPYRAEVPVQAHPPSGTQEGDLQREADRVIISRFGPAGVIVNEGLEVLGFRGKIGRYLEPLPGVASLNLLKLIRPELMVDLRSVFSRAQKSPEGAMKEGLRLAHNGNQQLLDLRVLPLRKTASERFFLVLFEDRGTHAMLPPAEGTEAQPRPEDAGGADARIRELEGELQSTREYMQSVIEDQESTNEELQSANEEIQSTNEELQSTNEELETAKEELQSTNEELATVNEELENRNAELTQSNNDLTNLLASVSLPILMLDQQLKVRQFTPQAKRLLNLIDTDVGRPIGNIRPNLDLPDLGDLAREVIDSVSPLNREVCGPEGRTFSMSMRPYKTHDQRIDGVVVTFFDLDQIESLRDARRLATVVRDANDAILVQDFTGRFLAWNPAAERIYGYTEAEALKLGLDAIVPEDERAASRALIDRVRRGGRPPPQRVRRRTKEGHELQVWLILSLLTDEDGAAKAVSSTERPVEEAD